MSGWMSYANLVITIVRLWYMTGYGQIGKMVLQRKELLFQFKTIALRGVNKMYHRWTSNWWRILDAFEPRPEACGVFCRTR